MLQDLIEKYNIENFSIDEITHGQDYIPEELHENIIPTLCVLQKIRSLINCPIFINSTYRTPEYNHKIHGAKNSLHLLFNAIDFKPYKYEYNDLCRLCQMIDFGMFECSIDFRENDVLVTPDMMGIGLYRSFIHIDTRGLLGYHSPARWYGLINRLVEI